MPDDDTITIEYDSARLIRFIAMREGDDHQTRLVASLLVHGPYEGCGTPTELIEDIRRLYDLGVLDPFIEAGML